MGGSFYWHGFDLERIDTSGWSSETNARAHSVNGVERLSRLEYRTPFVLSLVWLTTQRHLSQALLQACPAGRVSVRFSAVSITPPFPASGRCLVVHLPAPISYPITIFRFVNFVRAEVHFLSIASGSFLTLLVLLSFPVQHSIRQRPIANLQSF